MSTLCRLCVSTSWYRESLAGGPKVTSSSSPLVGLELRVHDGVRPEEVLGPPVPVPPVRCGP